jgi:hypothetical protein
LDGELLGQAREAFIIEVARRRTTFPVGGERNGYADHREQNERGDGELPPERAHWIS